jgi:hypothetical protein
MNEKKGYAVSKIYQERTYIRCRMMISDTNDLGDRMISHKGDHPYELTSKYLVTSFEKELIRKQIST